jgi:hypothetical protein
MRYEVTVGDRQEEVSSLEQLESWLRRLQEMPSAELWLVQKKGSMKGMERMLYRVLGLATEVVGHGVHILTNQDKATVTFVDRDYKEYHLLSGSGQPASAGSPRSAHGATEQTPIGEWLSIEEGFAAVRHFFVSGKRPERYSYRVVK